MEIKNLNYELKLMKESDIKPEKKAISSNNNVQSCEEQEIVDKRGTNSKTFQVKKGVFETKYYNTPIHCYDEEMGVFVESKNDIEEAEDSFTFANDGKKFKVIFYKGKYNNALFTMSCGNHRATVSLKRPFGKQYKLPMPILDRNQRKLTYANAVFGADIDCAPLPNGVGITTSIKDKKEKERHTFLISCENVKYQWNENEKSLKFISEDTGEVAFEIPAPFATDANNIYSENVSFEAVAVNDWECELTVIPDLGWLMSKQRSDPIKLEWVMVADAYECRGITFDRHAVSADGKVSINGNGVPFKMNLPKHRAGMITKNVRLLFHCDYVPVADDKEYLLALSRVIEFNNEHETSSEIIGISTMSVGKEEYAFDVTSEYSADENTIYSLQLCEKQNGEIVAADDTAVALMTVSSRSALATYSVTETDGTSENDSYTGETGNIGSVGTYEIDLVSGKLNMELKDFAWEGNRMPISISHTYKGQHASQNYGSWSSANGYFGNMPIGLGWRLNLMQSMVATGYQKVNDRYKDTFTYTDESGEETVFTQCECESGSATCTTYEDVNGVGYIYDANTGILKKGGETHTFISGRLVKICDEYGNTMNINYTSGRISSVRDGVGRVFAFGYSDGMLETITAPNGATVYYKYCNGNLCCITYPNGQKLSFAYETDDNQPDAITVSGDGITALTTRFTFLNGKVKNLTTVADKDISEKHTDFDFDANGKQTIVTEVDGKDQASDRIEQHRIYFHEHPEKNYTYYESSEENKIAVEGEHGVILPYTEPGAEIGNLRCQNLLKNHNFDVGIDNPTDLGWSTNLTGDYRDVLYDPPEKMPGFCAAYLLSLLSSDVERGIWQTVELECGKSYVFSCYLKLASGNSNPLRGVYLMVKSTTGSTVYRSQMITTKKEFQRVALPFTVDSACGTYFTVGIYIDGNTKAKVIAPQLEEGTMLSPYNYLAANEATVSVAGYSSCQNSKSVAKIKVPAAKDARETFTLSGYASGSMVNSATEGQETYAALKAKIYYYPTSEENREGISPPEEAWVPIYTKYATNRFAMVQFSKDIYRAIDYIEIICENNYNPYTVTFTDLQLVRNSYVDGLTEEDFVGNESDAEYDDGTDNALLTSTAETENEEIETIVFEELLDAYGNTLTGTNFKNGELGTIYTEQRFEETSSGDAYTDIGNNKTSEFDARGFETKYEYNSITSKPTAVIDRLDNRTEYTYDGAGRTTSVNVKGAIKNDSGEVIGYDQEGTVSYGYNSYDDLTRITRGDGQSYTMGYDAYRNLTSVNVGTQNLIKYEYKSGGNRLKSMEYANGAKQTLTYDRFGNIIGEAWNGAMKYRYFYDASNQLVKTLDISNQKMYNINRVGENITSIEEYYVGNLIVNGDIYTPTDLRPVGTMYYSFDSDGKQFRKKYIDADGNEQKYVFEYRDEQNVAVQLPTGVVSHAKSDHLGRKVFDELQLGNGLMNRRFTYHSGKITDAHKVKDENGKSKIVSTPETTLVKQIEFADGRTIEYEYDAEERITKVTDSFDGITEYTYDALGQLLTETVNDVKVNEMTYDKYGNIKTKNGIEYGYDSAWKDKLITYHDCEANDATGTCSKCIEYDANGNPTSYLGTSATWEKGRQLKTFGANKYWYNKDGIRIKKRTENTIHEYTLDGTNIIKETVTDICNCPKYVNEYLYDLDGTVCGLNHDGTAYYFYKNLQGDVIAITDNTGTVVARYTYDAWGKCTIANDTSGVNIATVNPFRYRSYYYDTETKLYYIQSRYYDPEVGRFINADIPNIVVINSNQTDRNLFAYCNNNVINRTDRTGYIAVVDDATFLLITIILCLVLVLVLMFMSTPMFKKAWEELYFTIYEFFSSLWKGIKDFIQIIKNYNEIRKIKKKIPKKLMKGDKVDLSKFNNPNGPKMPKGGRGILGPLGWYIVKDIDQHAGKAWKLFNKAGERIASLLSDGTIYGK